MAEMTQVELLIPGKELPKRQEAAAFKQFLLEKCQGWSEVTLEGRGFEYDGSEPGPEPPWGLILRGLRPTSELEAEAAAEAERQAREARRKERQQLKARLQTELEENNQALERAEQDLRKLLFS